MNDTSNSKLVDAKVALRRQVMVRRARAHEASAVEGRQLLSRRADDIVDQCNLSDGAVVAGYHPIRDEIDCLGLLAELGGRGFKIALPKMRAHENVLDFFEWDGAALLVPAAYGVMEPSGDSPVLNPQVALLPLLAFDLTGGRLGYGGGYYDRTLNALRSQGEVIAVGIGYDEQEVAVVPRDDHDQLLDFIATPTRIIKVPVILS